MRILLFGATGMVGSGVLIECLDDPGITEVVVVGRRSCGVSHPKAREIIHQDFFDYSAIHDDLTDLDACLFCVGVSSARMREAEYRRLTLDLTMQAAQTLLSLNPGMTFCYVSGAGADSTEQGRIMWARVRGELENRLMELPFPAAYVFRPAFIQPRKGVTSANRLYRVFYGGLAPLYPLLRHMPGLVSSTDRLGLAMIHVARNGYTRPILESVDINRVAAEARS